MRKAKKPVQIIFPEPTKICTKLRLYLRLKKKKREIIPCAEVIRTEISGPVYRVLIGKSYEVVTNKINHQVHSGRFTVRENEIEIDKKQPPPIVPILLK